LYRIVRTLTGLFYLVGGPCIHAYLMTQHRELYGAIDDQALVIYSVLWEQWVLPNLAPLVLLLVAFEMAAGALMLSRPHLAQYGQAAGLIFNLLLTPFMFGFGIPNLLLVALHGWLWSEEHRRARPATPALAGLRA
jgi:hypothetical protein